VGALASLGAQRLDFFEQIMGRNEKPGFFNETSRPLSIGPFRVHFMQRKSQNRYWNKRKHLLPNEFCAIIVFLSDEAYSSGHFAVGW
jgi:hypothetical protein